jgi:N utilization substance protein B
MASRHQSRERALQILYLKEMRGHSAEEAPGGLDFTIPAEDGQPAPEGDPFTEELVRGVAANLAGIDALIVEHSQNWRIERMSAVDRNLLRLAVYEMKYVGTPMPVVVQEAVRLAERFSGEEAVPFVNGILDAIGRSEPALPNPSGQ